MALFDDRRFLLSHIYHSFITGDANGMCEVVMLDEGVFENLHRRCLLNSETNSDNTAVDIEQLDPAAYDLQFESELIQQLQSYDINSEIDYISTHRRRSNTAQRLDKLKQEKINQSRIKTIVWRNSSPSNSQNEDRLSQDSPTSLQDQTHEIDELKEIIKEPPKKSGLSRLLEKYPFVRNPFDRFAQFDGRVSDSVHVNKIKIFMAINSSQANPSDSTLEKNISEGSLQNNSVASSPPGKIETIDIVINSAARVYDLIGLICWQYTNEGHEKKLVNDVDHYCLRIVEDNGEVDPDFPSLNDKEPLSKFGFPTLALTEKSNKNIKSDTFVNGNIYSHLVPSLNREEIASTTKVSSRRKLSALRRLIFRDAKLETT